MSTKSSPTVSVNSDTRAILTTTELPIVKQSNGRAVDKKVTSHTAGGLDSKSSSPKKPSDYRGTSIQSLAFFGKFEVKDETKKLPWVSDHTSGAVHPDIRTVSMLYNENKVLPKAAEKFIAQSAALQEEARWELVKAMFYSLYPQDLKQRVFEALKEMLPRNASRIIAMKTLRFEKEILLIPKPKIADWWVSSDPHSEINDAGTEKCSDEDAAKLDKALPEIALKHKEDIALALECFKTAGQKLSKHNSFVTSENISTSAVTAQSKLWVEELKQYQDATRRCIEARILSYHLDHAVARYEPRTGWIHVKTKLLRPGLKENKMLPKELFDIRLYGTYVMKGNLEEHIFAVDKQMGLFEKGLRTLSTGHLESLESYHNDLLYHEYEVHIPYASIKPSLCGTIVRTLLPPGGWNDFQIVSQPEILPYQKSHHVLKVYISLRNEKVPYSLNTTFKATLDFKDRYGCCLNCFSKDHVRVNCEEPVYDFANLVKVKDAN